MHVNLLDGATYTQSAQNKEPRNPAKEHDQNGINVRKQEQEQRRKGDQKRWRR